MGLPAHAAPAVVPSLDSLAGLFSADGERHRRWRNADARTESEVVGLDGATQRLGVTNVDRLLLERTRALGGRARGGNREVLEQLWGSYAAVSRTLASDVVGAVQAITATTQEKPDHLRAYGMYDMTFGLANGRVDMNASCEWILRLLKSDVTSVVYANLPERYYDYHDGSSVAEAAAATRAQLDILARMLGEMKATPSPDRPGRTLYDDTVVVIQSEFNRTWPRGASREDPESWTYGDDHNAVTSVLVSGGRVAGNRQIGGFELPSTEGLPVTIAEESGETSTRRPRAADFVATICDLFGMRMGEDFFIPGGYGVIRGLCE
ncbi:MAG: DUF1501 domain-containing protein [Sandaracinus sp.]|nr:DUF1501 domain-containing protein [Sandaracinus sp.]